MTPLIAFDVDGTLVNSNDLHAECWSEVFAEAGFDVASERVRPHIGKGGDHLIPDLIGKDAAKRHEKTISRRRDEHFQSMFLPRVTPFPLVRGLFEICRRAGWRTAVASSSPDFEVQHHLGLTGIAGLIDAKVTADDASHSKPDPDVFRAVLKKLGSPDAARCWVVGDTPYDGEAARAAGLQFIALLCGGFPESDLRAAGAVEVYADPADLLARFGSSRLATP